MLNLRTPASLVALASVALAATPVQVGFPAPPTGIVVQSNFLGISLELSYLNIYFGNDTSSTPGPMVNYLSAIRNHTGAQPIRLRLGGNSMDSATYVANQTDILVFTDPNANPNDQPVNFGPVLWDVMKAIGDAAGGAKYLVGLSLLAPNDSRAPGVPEMAGAAFKALGDDLDAFPLGNEPDLYTDHHKRDQYDNYTVPIYSSEFQAAINGLENTPSGNVISRGPSVAAPTICCNWNLDDLLNENWLNTFKDDLKYITLQHYPQNYCFGSYKYSVDYYQKHNEVVTLTQWQNSGINIAVGANKAVVMTEFNSVSCGGIPTISDTFAVGSLWTLDYTLQMATVGYSAAYVHTRERGVSYNLIDAPMPAGSAGKWDTLPPFYAALVAPEIFGAANGSRVVDLNLNNGMWTPGSDSAGYAAYDATSGAINRIALFNFANTTADGAKTFSIPKDVFTNATTLGLANANPKQVTVKFLTASSATEKWDISYAGSTYNGVADGKPVADASGRPGVSTLDCSEGCNVDVPAPGLAIVFVGGQTALSTAASTASGSGSTPSATGNSTAGSSHSGASTAWSASTCLGLVALVSAAFLL